MRKTKKIEKLHSDNAELINPIHLVNLSTDPSIKKFKFSADEKGEITLHIKWIDRDNKYEDICGTYNINMFLRNRYDNTLDLVDYPHDPNSTRVRKFTIPVGGKTKEESEKQILDLMAEYRKDIKFDENSGEVKINDAVQIPYTKDYWFPSETGKPGKDKINWNIMD